MSSRNQRLTPEERKMAPFIYQTLKQAVELKNSMSPNEVKQWVIERFSDKPQFTLEYFEIADDRLLQPVFNWKDAEGVVGFIAVFLGKVRLIDNIRFY
jgi:pantoate--beta-alanine ligase